MSELRDNMPENHEPVKGETGNTQLDGLFNEIATEPLLFSKEEAIEIIGAVAIADATTTTINRTVVVGGAILLTALAGWLYYQFGNTDAVHAIPKSNTVEVKPIQANNNTTSTTATSASNIETIATNKNSSNVQLSTVTKNTAISIEKTTQLANNITIVGAKEDKAAKENSHSLLASEKIVTSKASELKTEYNQRKSIVLVTKSNKKAIGKLILNKSPKPIIGTLTLQKESETSLFSKTKVIQRFYADGSATVAFEYNKEPALFTINPRGIEELTINNKLIKSDEYYLYEEIASEAFRRAKIEPLSGPTHDAKVIGDIPGIMTNALVRRNLINADEKFDFVLTGANAFLNGKLLDENQHLDLLQVYQNANGKSLPKEVRFNVKQ